MGTNGHQGMTVYLHKHTDSSEGGGGFSERPKPSRETCAGVDPTAAVWGGDHSAADGPLLVVTQQQISMGTIGHKGMAVYLQLMQRHSDITQPPQPPHAQIIKSRMHHKQPLVRCERAQQAVYVCMFRVHATQHSPRSGQRWCAGSCVRPATTLD